VSLSLGRGVCPKSAHSVRRRAKDSPVPAPPSFSWLRERHHPHSPTIALIAASATFALNAALCFLRFRFMSCSCATGAF